MNGEKAYADSERICRRGGHLLPDNHPVAERATRARRRAEATGSETDHTWQAEGLGNSSVISGKSSETRPQTQARMEKGQEAEARNGNASGINPLTLPFVLMTELQHLPECAGVYFVLQEGGHVVYVGQSVNIRQRWKAHHIQSAVCDLRNLEASRSVRLAWLEVEDAAKLDAVEKALIWKFRPPLNRMHNSEPKRASAKPEGVIRLDLDGALTARGKTLYWLASAEGADVEYASLWRLRQGKAKSISFELLDSICRALDCQPGELLQRESGAHESAKAKAKAKNKNR